MAIEHREWARYKLFETPSLTDWQHLTISEMVSRAEELIKIAYELDSEGYNTSYCLANHLKKMIASLKFSFENDRFGYW